MSSRITAFLLASFMFIGINTGVRAQTWLSQYNPTSGTSSVLSGGKIQFVSTTEGWISTSEGRLLHTTDAGTNWSVVTPFPSDTVWSFADPAVTMSWVNQTHGWKINGIGATFGRGYGAVLHMTTDGGSTWEKKVMSTTAGDAGLEVQFVDENTGWALIYNMSDATALFQKSTDGGNNWATITHDTVGIFCFVDANNGWSIMNSASRDSSLWINRTTDGGVHWATQYTDASAGGFNAIQFTDLQNGWVVGSNGKILRTTDGGFTWMKVTNTGIAQQSESKCLFFLNADTGWIGTNDGIPDQNPARVVLHTTNGGDSWTTSYMSRNDSSAVFSLFFQDANNGWLTGDYGLIEHTTNAGTGIQSEENGVPRHFALKQNYPNPFNPTTKIDFGLPKQSQVSLIIYDILGREVKELVNDKLQAGYYHFTWDATRFASGVYFYRIEAQSLSGDKKSFVEVKKLLLLK